jgi:hypothetical protein
MIKYTHKSDMILTSGKTVDMSAADGLTTSNVVRVLGYLAQLTFIKGVLHWEAPNGVDDTASALIRVKAGIEVLGEATLTDAGSVAVDLSGLSSTQEVSLEMECQSAGTDYIVNAWIEIEHPLIISA